jgi:hypothetical protein
MKRMRETIDEIVDLQNKFNFIEHTSDNDEVIRKRETFSDADEVPVGRMEEKERLISMLQTDHLNCLIGPVHPAYNPYFSACFFFQPEQCFSLTTNQPTVFFSRHSRTGPLFLSLASQE